MTEDSLYNGRWPTPEPTTCSWCGKSEVGLHYMTHTCEGCTCFFHGWTKIPGEPHIPSYPEMEPNIECPVHFTDEDRENTRIETEEYLKQNPPGLIPDTWNGRF